MRKIFILLLVCGFYSNVSAAGFKVGDRVQCNWQKKGTLYSGQITSQNGDKIHISYDDGDQEDTTADLCKTAPPLKVGDRVQCNWQKKGTLYSGKITSQNGDKIHISYDDGDQEDTTADLCRAGSAGGGGSSSSNSGSQGNCHFRGKPLFGKVQFVTSFPDVKVQVVTAIPDLKVQMVTAFPDSCGKWQEVTAFPDLKVQIVDSIPDIKIQYVTSFPGK